MAEEENQKPSEITIPKGIGQPYYCNDYDAIFEVRKSKNYIIGLIYSDECEIEDINLSEWFCGLLYKLEGVQLQTFKRCQGWNEDYVSRSFMIEVKVSPLPKISCGNCDFKDTCIYRQHGRSIDKIGDCWEGKISET